MVNTYLTILVLLQEELYTAQIGSEPMTGRDR